MAFGFFRPKVFCGVSDDDSWRWLWWYLSVLTISLLKVVTEVEWFLPFSSWFAIFEWHGPISVHVGLITATLTRLFWGLFRKLARQTIRLKRLGTFISDSYRCQRHAVIRDWLDTTYRACGKNGEIGEIQACEGWKNISDKLVLVFCQIWQKMRIGMSRLFVKNDENP